MAQAAILNGFGRTLGDGVIGLQALSIALRLGAIAGRPTLFRLPGLPPMLEALYRAADFADVAELPWAHATRETGFPVPAGFTAVIDIRDFAFDPDFLCASMIDFFLTRLGVRPVQVPSVCKRNTWLADRLVPVRPAALPDAYVLVCPRASGPLRVMPEAIHQAILARVGRVAPVVTQAEAAAGGVIVRPDEATLADLCGLVAGARLVIATDTAMVHLADAFAVPCLAFFPTHDPLWRVRDYPLCTPVALAGPLPRGLEFPRDAADLALAAKAWFPDGTDLSWLDRTIDAALAIAR